MPLQMWFDDNDWVIAESPEDCIEVLKETIGERWFDVSETGTFESLPTEEIITFHNVDDHEESVSRTVSEWVAKLGRCHVASANY